MTAVAFGKAEPRRSDPGRPGMVFYDDARARTFEPFALTRPVCTLTTGTAPMWRRWPILNQMGCGGAIVADHLRDFEEDLIASAESLPAGTIVANSRFAPAPDSPLGDDAETDTWRSGGRVVAVRLKRAMVRNDFNNGDLALDALAGPGARTSEIRGWWHEEVWDYLRHLPEILTADISAIRRGNTPDITSMLGARPAFSQVIGDNPIFVNRDARVEPYVVFDATAGPILVDSGAVVHSFTRINGPCYIGRNATIMGGDISGCSIGPVSKIRGEISGSIVMGYSNKGHDGFVGNSYFGRWVNLGAGTVTSNLKNTYGQVALWTPTGIRPTGMQFLGTLFGDHVKTGIGTKLTTGTVLGAGANVYGSKMPPKVVAPFSWGEGEPYDLYKVDKFLSTAATVMARRKVELSDRAKRQLTASFEKRWSVK